MGSFQKRDIKRRMLCSPIRTADLYKKLFICNFLYACFIWMAGVGVGFLIMGKSLFSAFGLCLTANYFIYTMSTLCIGILISYLVKSHKVLMIVAHTLSIGMSFLSGAFVSQSIMNTQVKNIGSFLPMYWYIKANDTLTAYTAITLDRIKSTTYNLMIILSIAAACLAVALMVSKLKETES